MKNNIRLLLALGFFFCVTGFATPATPTNFVVAPGNGQNSLSWNASVGAATYKVKRSGYSNGVYTLIGTVNAPNTTFVDNNPPLTNNFPYFYKLTAVDAGGSESLPAGPVVGVPALPLNPPANFTAIPGNGQVALSWSAAQNADAYIVARGLDPAGVFTQLGDPVVSLNYLDNGLTNGLTYYYQITSITNLGNQSVPSAPVAVTPTLAIFPPANIVAVAGDQTVSLSWSPATNALGYNVKRAIAASGPFTLIANGVTTTSYLDAGLTNSETYFYEVSSVNGAVESADSAPVSVTPVTSLHSPTNVAAVAGDAQVSLSWIAPTIGAIPTSYHIEQSLLATGPWTLVATSAGFTSTVNNLTNLQQYFFRVTSVNAGGESVPSLVVSATPVTSLQPPTGLVASAGGAQVTLSWTAPTSGSLPTSYSIEESLASSGPWTAVGNPSGTAFTVTGLTNQQLYYFRLRSINAGGQSATSAIVSATPVSALSAPTNLVAVGGDTQVTLSWNAPTSGPVPTSYNVKRSASSSGPWTLIGNTMGITLNVVGLTNQQTYYFVVTSVRTGDESNPSAVVSVTPNGMDYVARTMALCSSYTSVASTTPIVINTQADLAAMTLGHRYILGQSITLTGTWAPFSLQNFELNGAGHTIYGLNIQPVSGQAGLFTNLACGYVHDLDISSPTITLNNLGGYSHITAGTLAASAGTVVIHKVRAFNVNFPDVPTPQFGSSGSYIGGLLGNQGQQAIEIYDVAITGVLGGNGTLFAGGLVSQLVSQYSPATIISKVYTDVALKGVFVGGLAAFAGASFGGQVFIDRADVRLYAVNGYMGGQIAGGLIGDLNLSYLSEAPSLTIHDSRIGGAIVQNPTYSAGTTSFHSSTAGGLIGQIKVDGYSSTGISSVQFNNIYSDVALSSPNLNNEASLVGFYETSYLGTAAYNLLHFVSVFWDSGRSSFPAITSVSLYDNGAYTQPSGALFSAGASGVAGSQFHNVSFLQGQGWDFVSNWKVDIDGSAEPRNNLGLKPADCNGDGVVDLTDLGAFRAYFNQSSGYIPRYADLNRDGVSDLSDLGLFRSQFNQ